MRILIERYTWRANNIAHFSDVAVLCKYSITGRRSVSQYGKDLGLSARFYPL